MSLSTPSTGTHLASDLRHMIDETDQLLKSAVSTGDETFDKVRVKFSEQLQLMQSQLDDLERAGMARALHAVRVADRTARSSPRAKLRTITSP